MNTNIENFIERVRKYEDQKVKVATIEIEDFGEMEVQRPSANEMLKYQKELLSAINDVEVMQKQEGEEKENNVKMKGNQFDLEKLAKASSAFVYNSCSELRMKEIRDMYPKIAFEDIPLNIFGENQINSIAQKIYDAFKGKKVIKETVEAIKN